MASQFSVGDLVWAKMKGFSPWPGKIVNPTKDVKRPANKKPMQCVFFFGSDNYAWIPEEHIKSYDSFKEQNMKANKSGLFKEAVEAIEDFIRNKPKVPIRTSDLPSIDEELAAIFPNSNRGPPHKDYSRVPFGKGKQLLKSVITSPKTVLPKTKPLKDDNQKKGPNVLKLIKRRSSDETNLVTLQNKRPKLPEKLPTQSLTITTNTSTTYTAQPASPSTSMTRIKTKTSAIIKDQVPEYEHEDNGHNDYMLNDSDTEVTFTPQSQLLSRCSQSPPPGDIHVDKPVQPFQDKSIKPSELKFGFLGLGLLGQTMVKNLINSGHQLTIWNRTSNKCREIAKSGAIKASSAAEVVSLSDITFCCVSDPAAARDIVFGHNGVLQAIKPGKSFVEMSTIDVETSTEISEAVLARGGRYLEAPLSGIKLHQTSNEEGELIILAAGDRTLFEDCESCFQAIGKRSFYFGEVGNGCRMKLVCNVVLGSMVAGLAEGMALAERAGLSQQDVLDVLDLSPMACSILRAKGKAIVDSNFVASFPLKHQQKDLRLALIMADQLEQPLHLTATANEMYKHAKSIGFGDYDVSAVYKATVI